jgi:hypothetical protein
MWLQKRHAQGQDSIAQLKLRGSINNGWAKDDSDNEDEDSKKKRKSKMNGNAGEGGYSDIDSGQATETAEEQQDERLTVGTINLSSSSGLKILGSLKDGDFSEEDSE